MSDFRDRARGVLVGQAVGDVVGVPFEFEGPHQEELHTHGGGPFGYAPGQWSDDTEMALAIALPLAEIGALDEDALLTAIGEQFLAWFARGPQDVGNHVSSVLGAVDQAGPDPVGSMRARAAAVAASLPDRSGNGALMRTGVVALAKPYDREGTARLAAAVAALTHAEGESAACCVLWTEAVRLAVTEGRFDVRLGLDLVDELWRPRLSAALDEAERYGAREVDTVGRTLWTLQHAWAAIYATQCMDPATHVRDALTDIVRRGGDTDSNAAVAGQLLGARHGVQAFPAPWRGALRGRTPDGEHWLTALDLEALVDRVVRPA